MILEQQKQATVLSEGEQQETIKMSLDLDSAQFIMQELLSKGIYSDTIGSTIRETVSNALDSTRRAGTNKPIIVSFKLAKDGNYEFSVEDWGLGLDDNDVKNIVSKYGASTKRDSATELGVFGIGFKSALSYTSSFYFVCRKDGIERKYMMYEGEDVNSIDLLYESPTEEENGVKVIVPVKYYDKRDFLDKIKEQLAYFEGVYFDVNVNGETISNNFKIFRTHDFQWSELCSSGEMHICLDDVYYPIDFEALKINRINVPIGLKFGLSDGIFPTINREAIRLSPEAKETIINKIKKVADYFAERYNSSVKDTDDIFAIFDYYSSYARYVTIEGNAFEISELVKHSSTPLIKPKLNNVSLINLETLSGGRDRLLGEYKKQIKLYNGRYSKCKSWRENVGVRDVRDKTIMIYGDGFSGKKKEYIKETTPVSYNSIYFTKKTFEYKLFYSTWHRDSYVEMLDLRRHPKSEWRQRIQEFQYIQSLLLKNVVDVDKIEIPQEWLDARKRQAVSVVKTKKARKLEGEITGKEAQNLERYVDGKSCKFVPINYSLAKIPTMKHLILYTTHENSNVLQPFYPIRNGKLKLMTFSEREIKIIKEANIHNLISYEEFMKGENKVFKRYVTAYLIEQLRNKYKETFNHKDELKNLSVPLSEKLNELWMYRQKNYYSGSSFLYEEMIKVAQEYSLFDTSVYSTYLEVKGLLERYNFIEPVCRTMFSRYAIEGEPTAIDILSDLFKHYKYRMNYERYGIKLNEEITPELTEELIEQLTN